MLVRVLVRGLGTYPQQVARAEEGTRSAKTASVRKSGRSPQRRRRRRSIEAAGAKPRSPKSTRTSERRSGAIAAAAAAVAVAVAAAAAAAAHRLIRAALPVIATPLVRGVEAAVLCGGGTEHAARGSVAQPPDGRLGNSNVIRSITTLGWRHVDLLSAACGS